MLKDGYVLGGEQSGHIIFLNHNTTGDGLVTALKVAEVIKEKNKTFTPKRVRHHTKDTNISFFGVFTLK